MTHLHIDFETRSTVDIKKTGAYVYAEDPTTDLWCACFAFDDGEVQTWRPGDPIPDEIFDHVIFGGEIYAHNAAFERTIWHYILTPRYGWPEPATTQWRCTMVLAYAMALPGALEDAAPAAGIEARKDAAGHRLMMQMAKPRKVDKETGEVIWWDQPDKIERLIDYCRTDVVVERELAQRLLPLQLKELDLWHLDQTINDRGIYVDVPLCEAAKKIVAESTSRINAEMRAVTGGEVGKVTNTAQLIGWVKTFGIETESIAKDVIEDLLIADLPAPVRRALELRREGGKASVAKIEALLRGRSADGRARGLLQFHAAGTGRWGGRRFQPQNLKRPDLEDVDSAIAAVMTGDIDLVEALYDAPMSVVSDCLRGMIAAAPGNKIVAADYSNIEGRVLAWLAGEHWKLDAFRAYDAGTGPDLYKVMASRIYGVPVSEVTKPQRLIGKVSELACGYQGGIGAFQSMAAVYLVKVENALADDIKSKWRLANLNIRAFWYSLEEAAFDAVNHPGKTVDVRSGIRFKVAGSFLFMRLPSGRLLAYAYPDIRPKEMPWVDENTGKPAIKNSISYMGVNSLTKKWERQYAYGGMLAENATQAVSRDILADAMPRLEDAGYPIILTVHDEIVSEVPIGFGSVDEMISVMTTLPAWAEGCPVSAEGWEGERYRK